MARIRIEDINVASELATNEMADLFGGRSSWSLRRFEPAGRYLRLPQAASFGNMNSVLGLTQSTYRPINRFFQSEEEEEIQT